jgi:outer membrane protein TolC
MFPWFGTLKAQGDAAALMAEAKFQGFIDARNRLYLQVASVYYPLYELKEFIKIEEENVRILETYKSIVTLKFENGTGSMVDVLRVDIMLNDAQSNLVILRSKEKPLAIAFNKLLNRTDEEPVIISDTLVTEPISVDYRRDSLIASNPRLRAIDLRLKAGEASELAAQNLGKPRLGIGLDYVVVGERTDMSMPDNGKDIIMPMVSVSLPIVRNKYKASVREAQLMQESYKHEKQQVANSLFSDYEMALFEIQQQLQLLELYKEQVQTTRQSLNLLYSFYSNYGREFEEVLRMQQELLKYRKLRASALVNYHVAFARVNYLTSKEL